tara:strand:- start:77 stop:403 length:327 start_codon:yes stop_codon:yes gene_type:complete
METGGIIAAIVTGGIAAIAATIKMMDKNGFFCECKCCGCECKIDGRKSETRQMELQNKHKEIELNTRKQRHSIFSYGNKKEVKAREIQTPEFVEVELKEDKPMDNNNK